MKRFLLLVLLLLVTGSSGLSAQAGPTGAAESEGQVIRAGDLIRLKVWRDEASSGEILVHADGTAVIPRLGTMTVAGQTGRQVRAAIEAGLAKVMVEPMVDVEVLRRVRVLGAVTVPGLYPVEPLMTIEDAIALAGGATTNGRRDIVELVRNGTMTTIELPQRGSARVPLLQTGDELYVPMRPWLARNYGFVLSAVGTVVGIVTAAVVLTNSN